MVAVVTLHEHVTILFPVLGIMLAVEVTTYKLVREWFMVWKVFTSIINCRTKVKGIVIL